MFDSSAALMVSFIVFLRIADRGKAGVKLDSDLLAGMEIFQADFLIPFLQLMGVGSK